MFDCHGREFDSKATSAPLNLSSPGSLSAQGCRATDVQTAQAQQQRWLCSCTQHWFQVSPVTLASIKHQFFSPVFFHSKCQEKKKWGQCYCNMMLRACAAHREGMPGSRWCWDSDGGLRGEQGAKFSAVSSLLSSGTVIPNRPKDQLL